MIFIIKRDIFLFEIFKIRITLKVFSGEEKGYSQKISIDRVT